MNPIQKLLQDLAHPGMPTEVAVLVGCLLAAFGFCWLLGRKRPADSVWFGRATIDGLMFPLVALALVYGASRAVALWQAVVLL